MRASLVLVLTGAAAVAACVVPNLGGAPAAAQDAAPTRSSSVAADTLKDVEVMRRVLVREGLATRSGDTAGAHESLRWALFPNAANGGSVSEAFVVPGQGATFFLRTSDPVAAPQGADETAAAPEKPSAWDEEAAALEGRTLPAQATRRRGEKYEAAKVEALRTRVLDVLAKYGQKVRGLAPSDRLTVIVVGGGGAAGTDVVFANSEGGLATYHAALAARSSDARTVLVIHAALSDCQAAAAGSLSADDFRRRAVVSAY